MHNLKFSDKKKNVKLIVIKSYIFIEVVFHLDNLCAFFFKFLDYTTIILDFGTGMCEPTYAIVCDTPELSSNMMTGPKPRITP